MNSPSLSDIYSHMPHYLSWKSGANLPAEASAIHLRWMSDRLRTWAHVADPGLLETLRAMPQTARKRVMNSPVVFHLLHRGVEPEAHVLKCLNTFLRTELDVHNDGKPERWTALADHYYPPPADRPDAAAIAHSDEYAAQAPYDAPVVNGIVLDTHSPAGRIMLREFSPLASHTADELEVIRVRVREVLDYVNTISPAAGNLVSSSIKVLALRKSLKSPRDLGSVSWSPLIGMTGLLNAHVSRWSVAHLCDSLVHEAIHGMLYKFELVSPFYTDQEAANQLSVVSPWSQRNLKLHSFVHACFVWYGLWEFWSKAPLDDPRERYLLDRARNGFQLPGPLAGASEEALCCIQPHIRQAIEQMSNNVVEETAALVN